MSTKISKRQTTQYNHYSRALSQCHSIQKIPGMK